MKKNTTLEKLDLNLIFEENVSSKSCHNDLRFHFIVISERNLTQGSVEKLAFAPFIRYFLGDELKGLNYFL